MHAAILMGAVSSGRVMTSLFRPHTATPLLFAELFLPLREQEIWRAVCIKNIRDISNDNFGPRQRGRGQVGVTDVGVGYFLEISSSALASVSRFLLSSGSPLFVCACHCLRGPGCVSLRCILWVMVPSLSARLLSMHGSLQAGGHSPAV